MPNFKQHILKLPLAGIAAAALMAMTNIHAQTRQAGLWAHTYTDKTPGGEMEKARKDMRAHLAAMPQDQRRRAEQALASQGVSLEPQTSSQLTCVTPSEATRPAEPTLKAGCTLKELKRSGNNLKYTFTCTQPQAYEGLGQVVFADDKSYMGTWVLTGHAKRMPAQIQMAVSGQWLLSDCGDTQPDAARSQPRP